METGHDGGNVGREKGKKGWQLVECDIRSSSSHFFLLHYSTQCRCLNFARKNANASSLSSRSFPPLPMDLLLYYSKKKKNKWTDHSIDLAIEQSSIMNELLTLDFTRSYRISIVNVREIINIIFYVDSYRYNDVN